MHFIIGGARSGKTAYAERIALTTAAKLQLPVTYIATGVATDLEMEARIKRHRELRVAEFQLREFPRNLDEQLSTLNPRESGILLIDCLSTYLGTASYDQGDEMTEESLLDVALALLAAIEQYPWPIMVVSNEVGMGIVPLYESVRVYRDVLGRANARFAEIANDVTWHMAGFALSLKRDGVLSPCCEKWADGR